MVQLIGRQDGVNKRCSGIRLIKHTHRHTSHNKPTEFVSSLRFSHLRLDSLIRPDSGIKTCLTVNLVLREELGLGLKDKRELKISLQSESGGRASNGISPLMLRGARLGETDPARV